MRIVEQVRHKMGRGKPLFTTTVDEMIEAYTSVELKKLKKIG